MKLNIVFHYEVDEHTGEITYLGKEELTVDTAETKKKSSSSSKKVDNNPDPIVTLDTNKLILTKGAVDLLKVEEGGRIDIKYDKKDKRAVPVIGTDTAFGSSGKGNKLTKSNTISFRGNANEKLASYGTTFTLEPTENIGIFYLIGDKKEQEVPKELINIESELDIESLDNEDIDLSDFDFSL